MASSFTGRFVEVTLHGGQVVLGTISSVDPVQQTLSIASDHRTFTWPKTQIASLSLRERPAAPAVPDHPPSSSGQPAPSSTAVSEGKTEHAPAPAPAKEATKVPAPPQQRAPAASAPAAAAAPASQAKAPGTPRSHASPRPEATVRDRKKSKARKAATHSPRPNYVPGAPAPNPNPVGFTDDFDFNSALGKFDKQKAFEDFRNADKTDPAQLLVSHNKATPGLIHLVRGPNGVGPVPQSPAAAHPRGAQDKLGLHEPVLSPPASEQSFPAAKSTSRAASRSRSQHSEDPEKDELRARVALLEALSGLSVSPAPPAEGVGKRARTYYVKTWRDHVAQSTAEADPQQPEGQLQFTTAAIPAPSKDAHGAKLLEVRYLGVDANRSHRQVFDAIPGKYHRSFTLRPQTASIFIRRLRAAAFQDAEK